jgi:ABC-2 type transport system ATP-binding protein/lipopolysaccharide transport system ATP-binding protein
MTHSAAAPDVSIILDKATVEYQLFSARGRSLKGALLRRTVGGQIKAGGDGIATSVKALDNITLTLRPGVKLGLIGRNGAGKTTLLRALAGIYEPTGGRIIINGTTASMTDLMMGMDMEATGRENIFLRGVFLGLSFERARALVPEIADFTELGEYLDLPMRTYSAGMMLRLSFAVSTSLRPDILIMDEVIGVGDQSFYAKAEARLNEMIDSAHIFVVASHDNDIIRRFCNRAMVLHQGHIMFDGEVEAALAYYAENLKNA